MNSSRRTSSALTGLGASRSPATGFATRLRSLAGVSPRPDHCRATGVLGDALLELGRYDAAFAAFDRMAALKPNTSSYARVSYARELLGDVAGAIGAMELALDAAARRARAVRLDARWSSASCTGRSARSRGAASFRLALAARPGYRTCARRARAIRGARGHGSARAVALQRRAVEAIPLPRLRRPARRPARGRRQNAGARAAVRAVAAIEKIQAANGSRIDLESALYRDDRGIRLGETLELARLAHVRRPSVAGDDVLAWALARNGRCGEARR